ncbi:MAG TPA: AAA family ATPase [Candidatus Dormibacteraeota bacterium]
MGVSRGGRLFRPGAVAPAPIELGFRGRARELSEVRSALRSLARGAPARVLVIGEQGIGKSRLIAEALGEGWADGIVLYAGRGAELRSDRAFGVLIDALDLPTAVGAVAPREHSGLIPLEIRGTDDAEQRHDLVKRIAALVRRRTAATPVALLIEDAHWADPFTVATLAELVAACTERPLGILLTRRVLPLRAPVDELFEQGLPAFQRIDLDALDPEVVALLAHDVLGSPPGPRLQEQIDGAGGNPAMLVALLQGSISEGTLRRHEGIVETDALRPPVSMCPAVLARISRLSDRCQDLLTVAAVFERPFGVATLAAVAGRTVIEVLTDLREALGARVLLEVAGVLSFQHQLVRQILYDATPMTVRAELHAQITDALQADRGSPALIGHHRARTAEHTPPRWERLTNTEREVALLAAQGLSNKQAGARLHVSARTIETHLAHVYAKLGIHSRVELAADAGRAGIAAPGTELTLAGRAVASVADRRPNPLTA